MLPIKNYDEYHFYYPCILYLFKDELSSEGCPKNLEEVKIQCSTSSISREK